MGHDGVRTGTATSDAAAARRWAERLEARPWRWLTKRRLVVVAVVGFLLLLSAQQWWQYREYTHAGAPVPECSSTERVVEYDVRWQWLPPGVVCVFTDGTSEYVGL